jgi:hypothetical protein
VADPSSPRAIASYLIELREPLLTANRQRSAWVNEIGRLMEDARHGNPLSITQTAGAIGRQHGAAFRDVRARVNLLRTPPRCASLQGAMQRWLDKLIEACDLLVNVAHNGRIGHLKQTQALFVDGRHHAQQFNLEYSRVVDELKERVAWADRRRAPRAVGRPA